MPKKVFSIFNGGLSDNDRNLPDNQFAIGDGVDIHSDPGYILPSPAIATITKSNDSPQILQDSVKDIAIDVLNSKAYHHDGVNLYQQTTLTSGIEAFNSNFDGSSHYYKAIGSAAFTYDGEAGVVMYKTNDVSMLFYIYGTAAAGDIGRFDLSSTFADTFMSGTASGGAALQKAKHPYLVWNSYLWVGNGRYLAKYDGTAAGGSNGTFYATQLDLGFGWEIIQLFQLRNYIGIVARYRVNATASSFTDLRIFFYDGSSTNYTYFIPLSENVFDSLINHNGKILGIGYGRNNTSEIIQITDDGNEILALLRAYYSGSLKNVSAGISKGSVVIRDRVLFASGAGQGTFIFSWGRNKSSESYAFSFPLIVSTGADDITRCFKHIGQGIYYISWTDIAASPDVHYLSRWTIPGSTYITANFRTGYLDFGQKVRVNYIKYYFKPLVSGDSVVPKLDVDYGTAKTIKDRRGNNAISFALDGGTVTSKLFPVGEDCHSFRVGMAWSAGGVAFSKIVVDYDFIEDT